MEKVTNIKKQSIYRGSRPTNSDVQLLLDYFKIPKEGDIISSEEVSKVINIPIDENRWRNVTIAWRKKLFEENNLEFDVIGGDFKCLNATERISKSCRLLRKAVNASSKAAVLAMKTDSKDLSTESKLLKDFTINNHVILKNHYLLEAKKFKTIPDLTLHKLI